jgi:hypothetical protein
MKQRQCFYTIAFAAAVAVGCTQAPAALTPQSAPAPSIHEAAAYTLMATSQGRHRNKNLDATQSPDPGNRDRQGRTTHPRTGGGGGGNWGQVNGSGSHSHGGSNSHARGNRGNRDGIKFAGYGAPDRSGTWLAPSGYWKDGRGDRWGTGDWWTVYGRTPWWGLGGQPYWWGSVGLTPGQYVIVDSLYYPFYSRGYTVYPDYSRPYRMIGGYLYPINYYVGLAQVQSGAIPYRSAQIVTVGDNLIEDQAAL